ncbi:MAG: thioredoxin domain-containing protein [Myxococcota bacterium]|nr:thioredoxin domain-containing protein [Myxococcota bacterium]
MQFNPTLYLLFFSFIPIKSFAQDSNLETHLAKLGPDQFALIKFEAGWCDPCQKLKSEVFEAPKQDPLIQRFPLIQVDFDAPTNRHLVEEFNVLGLPTVVVVDANRQQIGRVSGYSSPQEFVQELQNVVSGQNKLTTLTNKFINTPSLKTKVALGHAYLVRGQQKEGETLLQEASWNGVPTQASEGAQALFYLGRYHQRVRRDPKQASGIWRQLMGHYPNSSFSTGALWWYIKAAIELKQLPLANSAIQAQYQVVENPFPILEIWWHFIKKTKLYREIPNLRNALTKFAQSGPKPATQKRLEEILSAIKATPSR